MSAAPSPLAAVQAAFESLPQRYLGAAPGFDADYQIRLRDLGQTWEVRCTSHAARVHRGVTRRQADVVLSTDSATWLALREGRFSGIEAFQRRRLTVHGNLDHAIAFEGMFRLPGGRPPRLQVRDVQVARHRISTLTTGAGPDEILLVHGLGATRASMFEIASQLGHRHRVHAVDLPGFGASSKPARGAYNARWFAEILLGWMDKLEISQVHVVGNSMGGRIAIELGLMAPERIRSLGLLCPAVAWLRRGLHPIVRLLRPELGLLPHAFTRSMVASQLWGIFHDPGALDPSLGDLVVDEFRRIYRSPGARLAFLSSARNIYLEKPLGRGGFYPRLSNLQPRALFVWGSHDPLVPAAFSRHVARWLPDAEQVKLADCGHVPQVERPRETLALLEQLFASAAADRDRTPTRAPTRRRAA